MRRGEREDERRRYTQQSQRDTKTWRGAVKHYSGQGPAEEWEHLVYRSGCTYAWQDRLCGVCLHFQVQGSRGEGCSVGAARESLQMVFWETAL